MSDRHYQHVVEILYGIITLPDSPVFSESARTYQRCVEIVKNPQIASTNQKISHLLSNIQLLLVQLGLLNVQHRHLYDLCLNRHDSEFVLPKEIIIFS